MLTLAADLTASGTREAPVSEVHSARPEESAPLDFVAIYRENFPRVVRWARFFGGNRTDVEDVAQEVFLTVRRKLPEFDGRNLSGWLYQLTRSATRGQRRLAWARRVFFLEDQTEDPLSHHGSPEEEATTRQQAALASRLVEQLAEPKRVALLLHELEGWSGEQIAAHEGVPLATVYTRIHHARRELAELLRKSR